MSSTSSSTSKKSSSSSSSSSSGEAKDNIDLSENAEIDPGLVSISLTSTAEFADETQPVEESMPSVVPQPEVKSPVQEQAPVSESGKEKKSSSSSSSSSDGGEGVEVLGNAQDDKYDYIFKIIMIGDAAVGKTALFRGWGFTEFDDATTPTLSPELLTKNVKISGDVVRVSLWDTAGQEQFRSITRNYYRNSTCAIIVYDITRADSFESAERWLSEIKEGSGNEQLNIMLVGNKSDLKHQRQVTKSNALEFAKHNQLHFLETSAKEGKNVKRAFNILLLDTYKEKRHFLQANKASENQDKVASETVVIGGGAQNQEDGCEC